MFGKIPQHIGSEIEDAVLTVTEKDAAKLEWPLNRRWAARFFLVGAAIVVLLFGRGLYLNVFQGEKYRAIAERNSIRLIPLPTPRGIVYDRFGVPLVRNLPSIDAVLVPFDAPKDTAGRQELKSALAATLSIPSESVDAAFALATKNPLTPVLLKKKLSQEEVIAILSQEKRFLGINLFKSAYREYMDSVMFSHVLGYEGKITEGEYAETAEAAGYLPTDSVGKQGIEKSYERELRGERGFERVEVDAFGRPKKVLGTVQSKPGSDLFLSIDAELQKRSFDALASFLESKGLKRGAVVALDPRDGAVRALVSIPSFDNNLFAEGISSDEYRSLIEDESKPLFNRVIAGEYPPGSTFKPVIASAALSERLISEDTRIESRGGIQVGNFFFGDWKAHGFTDLRGALAVSSDVYFYSIGGGYGGIPGLGITRMKSYAERFGYGALSGIDIPGERDGFLPDPEWKKERFDERWYIGDDYNTSIGQGFVTTTPLQIANSVAAVANGGTLYEPHVVSQVRTVDGKVFMKDPKVIRSVGIDPHILEVVREGMREAVTEGTAQSLANLPVPVAGKTGTAQFGTGKKTHGWFASFAPYDRPELVMVVLVENQETDTYNAVPVTREIYDWYFRDRMGKSE